MTTFKKVADFDVARYMGHRSWLRKCVEGFLRNLFVGHNNAFPDEFIHGAFDWDGETIWTPCGYEHAFNIWSRFGQFVAHVNSDEAACQKTKDETRYVYRRGLIYANDIVFGDNRIVFCLEGHQGGSVRSIFKAKGDSAFDARQLTVSSNGEVLFKAGQVLNILSRPDVEATDFVTDSIPLGEGVSWFKLLENSQDGDSSYVGACAANKNTATRNEPGRILLISLKRKSVFNRVEVDGVQDFSRHPGKDELVVLGRKLSVLSLPDLKTINTIELPLTGKERNADSEYSVIRYSSNGDYLALAYAANGDVEIRDAKTLEIMHTFGGFGTLLPDMSWDRTGRYLACRYKDQKDGNQTELRVWDVRSHETVLRISTRNKLVDSFPVMAYRWSPLATELACLVDNQRIQIFELR